MWYLYNQWIRELFIYTMKDVLYDIGHAWDRVEEVGEGGWWWSCLSRLVWKLYTKLDQSMFYCQLTKILFVKIIKIVILMVFWRWIPMYLVYKESLEVSNFIYKWENQDFIIFGNYISIGHAWDRVEEVGEGGWWWSCLSRCWHIWWWFWYEIEFKCFENLIIPVL